MFLTVETKDGHWLGIFEETDPREQLDWLAIGLDFPDYETFRKTVDAPDYDGDLRIREGI